MQTKAAYFRVPGLESRVVGGPGFPYHPLTEWQCLDSRSRETPKPWKGKPHSVLTGRMSYEEEAAAPGARDGV